MPTFFTLLLYPFYLIQVSSAMGAACNACSNAVLSLHLLVFLLSVLIIKKVLHLSCSLMVLNIYLQSAKRVILCVLRNL